jgi:hypothetical protein
MRVLRFHYARPTLTVGDAHSIVKELALRVRTGEPSHEDRVLEEKLKKATGLSIAALAMHAEDWPA